MAEPTQPQPQPQPQPPSLPHHPLASCIYNDCSNSSCTYTCVWFDPFLSPTPPPPPPPPTASHGGVAPFLIAVVCILGISFLLLTTCTIIFRYRFTRRRNGVPTAARFDDGGGGDVISAAAVDHPIWHIATVGLQQSVIDSITSFKYGKIDGLLIDGSDCSVCLTEFNDGDDLRLLPKCSHAFHMNCIDVWLRSHKNCPLCRAPVVNESAEARVRDLDAEFSVVRVRSGDFRGDLENLGSVDGGVDVEGGESSNQVRERGEDDFVELILKRNCELRIYSDLGENYRFRREDEGVEPIRRSVSSSSSAAGGICRSMSDVCSFGYDEGCSSNNSGEEKKMNVEKLPKRGSSMSGLFKTSSFGRSLQKGPVSMKRSFSSGGKLFSSFRRMRNQASILPL